MIVWTLNCHKLFVVVNKGECSSDICTINLLRDNYFSPFFIGQKQWKEKEEDRE